MSTAIAVVYKFKLKTDRVEEYLAHYAHMVTFMKQRGAIGSVIHQAEDGHFMIYSRWPDQATHQAAWPEEEQKEAALPHDIYILSEQMKDCIADNISKSTFTVQQDYLLEETTQRH